MAVTASEVIALTGSALSEALVATLITDAELIVSGCGYTGDRLDAIVKWLSAHLVATIDAKSATVTSDKLGDAAKTYSRAALGDGLRGTLYGQQALALDVNGCLAGIGKGRASVQVI